MGGYNGYAALVFSGILTDNDKNGNDNKID
jgi:hypothetical protein